MWRYSLSRVIWMIPTLVGIVTITFFLTRLRPDPLSQSAMGPEGLQENSATEQYLTELRKFYGYDLPLHQQYLKQWSNLLTLDLGTSRVDQRPVWEKLKEAMPYTITLNLITIFLVYIISIPLGIYQGIHDNEANEKFITLILYMLYSLPSFWVALMLLKYFSGGDYFDILPLGGWSSDDAELLDPWNRFLDLLWHLFLPVLVSVYGSFAFLSRFIKSSFLEALKSDYIRTARAKGLSERRTIYFHALRNSLIPLITLMAGLLPGLFGGSVIIESIFSIPGMGKLAYDSIYANDDPIILAIVTFSAILTMLGILITDLLYTLVDPRINFEKNELA